MNHDISNKHRKFYNNRFGSFGDYLSNKNPDRLQADGKGDQFLHVPEIMKRRENMKVACSNENYY